MHTLPKTTDDDDDDNDDDDDDDDDGGGGDGNRTRFGYGQKILSRLALPIAYTPDGDDDDDDDDERERRESNPLGRTTHRSLACLLDRLHTLPKSRGKNEAEEEEKEREVSEGVAPSFLVCNTSVLAARRQDRRRVQRGRKYKERESAKKERASAKKERVSAKRECKEREKSRRELHPRLWRVMPVS